MNTCNYNIKQIQNKITYSYKYNNNYNNILIRISVIILYYYMNTIGDKRNEKDFYGHCNDYVYIQDYEQVF